MNANKNKRIGLQGVLKSRIAVKHKRGKTLEQLQREKIAVIKSDNARRSKFRRINLRSANGTRVHHVIYFRRAYQVISRQCDSFPLLHLFFDVISLYSRRNRCRRLNAEEELAREM